MSLKSMSETWSCGGIAVSLRIAGTGTTDCGVATEGVIHLLFDLDVQFASRVGSRTNKGLLNLTI